MTIGADELIGWYDVAARDLPWRRPGVSPWQILVSEFMLQQTPVSRVQPVWEAWVDRWPTPSATAAASAADVLRAWGKLGYPRRAKRLHECATVIARDYDDVVPDDVRDSARPARRRCVHGACGRLLRLRAIESRWWTPTCDGWSRAWFTGWPTHRAAPRDLADVDALLPKDGSAARVFGRR